MPLPAGTRIGPYEVVSLAGSGGMGDVYRARDTRLGRDVALKVLPEALAGEPERLARFRREAHVIAALNHSNIAQVYDFEETPEALALAMELVEGPTLAEVIDRLWAGAAPGERRLGDALSLDDTLQIARQMWSTNDGPYEGKHYRLAETICHPAPVHGRLPILIGGGGERKTLRLVAQYADACNLFDTGLGPEGIPRKLDVLRGHCEDVGRPYDEISKTCLARLTMDTGSPLPDGVDGHSVEQAVDRLGRLREAGIDHVICSMANTTDPAAYDLVAEVVRRVA